MMFRIFFQIAAIAFLLGCGVKGDPLPPDVPADLGRGRPTFKKAVKDVEPVAVPGTGKAKEDEENEKSKR